MQSATNYSVRVRDLLRELNVDSRYGINPQDAVLFGQESVLIDHALLVYASNQLAGADVDAGVSLTLSPAEHGDLGLVVSPFGVRSRRARTSVCGRLPSSLPLTYRRSPSVAMGHRFCQARGQ